MKKYCLTYMAAIAALSASAAAPQAERKTDSLHIASLSPREAATIDSIVAMRLRLQPKQIESIFDTNDVVAIDTLDSGNDAIQVVGQFYNDLSFSKMTSSAGQKANWPISPGVIQRMSWCSRSCGTPERMEAFRRVRCTVRSG